MPSRHRTRLPWFPTIKCEDCLLDLECLNFCPANVFDWDHATGRPVVTRPFDCIPGCRSCAENCKGNNISLPGKREVAAALKRVRAEDGISHSQEEIEEWGLAMSPRGENKHAKGNKTESRKARNRPVIILAVGKNKVTE